ncbi:MAG: carboxymuconolactone decarboxylase family protein [Ignavibacteriae bacterium]|nr:carboxymuconolactone decarboxylase family protein [Ignavibacteriota bacterium]NOG98595.1 carboxymuconolactone decarboxylase family protein [Ignavibacteriota bacterium]
MRLNWYKAVPNIYKAMLELQKASEETKLDKKLLELIKIRASQINGCAHCLEMHTKDAAALGENELRIHLLSAWREAPVYSEREKAALALCESLTLISHAGVPDSVYDEAAGIFSSKELVELTLAIIAINGWNRLAVGFKSEVGNYVSTYNK